MKKLLLATCLLTALAACTQEAPAPQAATTPATEQVVQAPATPAAPVATGDAFATPLPQGVVLQPPFHARLDQHKTKPDGTPTRRTEHEFLEGDATQAMAKFAESMTAAGFKSPGAKIEGGVVRQFFTKEGYGTVNARAQEEDAAKHKHASARGFVVVAWPKDDAATTTVATAAQ